MNESANNITSQGQGPGEADSTGPVPPSRDLGPAPKAPATGDDSTLADYSLRLLAHSEAFARARDELRAATAAMKVERNERNARRLTAAMQAHANAERRFRRSAWRVRQEVGS